MGLFGWVSKVACFTNVAGFLSGCGVISFEADAGNDAGLGDRGPPDRGVPEPRDTGSSGSDLGPRIDGGDCRPVVGLPQGLPPAWPFGNTQADWSAAIFDWASGIGPPAVGNRCSLGACHGGTSAAAVENPPFVGSDAAFFREAIATFYPYLLNESDHQGSVYTGRLWRHIDPDDPVNQYAGPGGDQAPYFSAEDIQFLKQRRQMAWSCGAAPVLESQDAGPNCGPPEPPAADAGELDGGADSGQPSDNRCYCEVPDIGALDTSLCDFSP